MIGDIVQPTHLIFVLVVALLVLGPKRLPEVGRSLGRGLRDFRQGMQGVEQEARAVFSDALDEPKTETSGSSTGPVASSVASQAAPTPHFVVRPNESSDATTTTADSAATATAVAAEPDPADYAD
jgi:sec-independent protein translocase protein TatA